MDDKKKILLGEKDILSKSTEDLFINLNLNSTFSEIRNNKFDNVFDVSKQFDTERNTSRDFRVYGIIDSTVVDCDNFTLYAYSAVTSGTGINSGTTVVSGTSIATLSSTTLVYDGLNAFAKKRGKYLLELSGYTNDFVYIKIPSNNSSFKDQIYSQQLIFRDADGNFVNYGTQTIDITENGDTIEINNDFYFLYNKHWIKKDLLITEEKHAKVSFSGTSIVEIVPETTSISTNFQIALNKPSPFGLEKVDLEIVSRSLDVSEIILQDTSGNTINTFPSTFSFAVGEQIKGFTFYSPVDFLQEQTENVFFNLTNFQFVDTGSPLNHQIQVIDSTPRNLAKLNFQNIYQNRNYFAGKTTGYSVPMNSVLRNGLNFGDSPMEFYPIDNFNLSIKNLGTDTIFPINPSLGVSSEFIFPANQDIQFNVETQYQNTEKSSIKFYFAKFNATNNVSSPLIPAVSSGFTINGMPIVDYFRPYKIDYEKFLACFKNINISSTPTWAYSNTNIGGWGRYNLDRPFDVFEDLTGLTITLTAKNPGTKLDLKSYGGFPDLFDSTNPKLQDLGITAETLQTFVQSAQTPLEIILGANFSNNTLAKYRIKISKKGYTDIEFIPGAVADITTAVIPPTYYLISGFSDMLRNWDNSSSEAIYIHSGVTEFLPYTSLSASSSAYYTIGDTWINGIVLLANYHFTNNTNTSLYFPGGPVFNLSNFGFADFLASGVTVEPSTNEYYSPQLNTQKGYIGIISSSAATPSTQRAFDFRTGTTSAYSTFYFPSGLTAQYIWNTFAVKASGATTHTGSLPLNYYLTTPNSYINNQGIIGASPVTFLERDLIRNLRQNLFTFNDLIRLESPTPGVPFEVTNLLNLNYFEIVPNEIPGVTINKANNFLGGFTPNSPTFPLASIRRGGFTTFNQPTTFNGQSITVQISLDAPSTTGTESVVINNLGGTAISGVHYTTTNTFPLTVTWAAGEQVKFLIFQNIYNGNIFIPKNFQLGLTNFTNMNLGGFQGGTNITLY